MPPPHEQPSPRELHQLIVRNHQDLVSDLRDMQANYTRDLQTLQTNHTRDLQAFGAQLAQFVLREVYEAREAALGERLKRLEDEAEHDRSTARTAMWAGVAAVIAAIVGTVLQIALTKGVH
jgi:exonuclease VII large subunit